MDADAKDNITDIDPKEDEGFFSGILYEIINSPLNLFLLFVCVILLYKIFKSNAAPPVVVVPPSLPKLKKQDMTLEQLAQYDGTGEEGRVCTGVLGKVFDVTRGKKFYGPGGVYSAFAGKDATRALATFRIDDVRSTYDDISDLTSMQMESVKEWQMQFYEKYDPVGRLLKPGEEGLSYSDEDENSESKEKASNNTVSKDTNAKKDD